MWILLLVIVLVLLAVFARTIRRDALLCPVCGHPMSQHEIGVLDITSRSPRYCKTCKKQCT